MLADEVVTQLLGFTEVGEPSDATVASWVVHRDQALPGEVRVSSPVVGLGRLGGLSPLLHSQWLVVRDV